MFLPTFDWFKIIATISVAVLASWITRRGLNSDAYKQTVVVSQYQPPSYIFSLVWILIYVSYAYVWVRFVDTPMQNFLFAFNLVLNLLWCMVFFGPSQYNTNTIYTSRVLMLALLALTWYQAYDMWRRRRDSNDVVQSVFPLVFYGGWLVIATILNFDTRLLV